MLGLTVQVEHEKLEKSAIVKLYFLAKQIILNPYAAAG